jgi:predicted  nucleic acid-binding Zn-ribbon protein
MRENVKEDLRLLRELQEIDSALVKKTAAMNAIPKKISSVEQPFKDAQSAYEKNKQKNETLAKKRKDKERSLDDIQEKIKKLKMRTSDIKTNKEYQALLKEIESAEKEQHAAEDEILVLMEALDAAHKELNGYEATVKGEEEKIAVFKKKLREEVEETEKELESLRHRREQLARGIDGELYTLYYKLLETKRGLAVVGTKEEVCLGCNMNIPPQLFVEIKKNERIIQCPQCNRILYAVSSRISEEQSDHPPKGDAVDG